ncbi:MAG TPA: ubiquinol-cytochrome c reductase iron-sulfur subunit [Bryobacteraceae bacterium]|nr:ubiquinol-cytochrome c reductase iron-sulfur subunit [Bryobacteraceae bacterium]
MSGREINISASQSEPSRRSYVGWLMGLCSAGVGAALSVPLIRFALYPLTTNTTETKWSDVGPVSDFGAITTPVQRSVTVEQLDGWRKTISEKVVYVTKEATGRFRVLSAICPHLGCSVQWAGSKHQFVCPCHGASFETDGTRTGGPAPRGMDSLESTVQGDRLVVRYHYFRQLVPEKEIIG